MGLFSNKKPPAKHIGQDRYPGPPGKANGADLIEDTRPCIWCWAYFRPASAGEKFCCSDHAEKAAQS